MWTIQKGIELELMEVVMKAMINSFFRIYSSPYLNLKFLM